MNKLIILLCLYAFNLNAQSKLYQNLNITTDLNQSIANNILTLGSTTSNITKVVFFNKKTSELKDFQNASKNIAIKLDKAVVSGPYTIMVHTNGDIIVLNADIKSSLNESGSNIANAKKPPEIPIAKKPNVKFYRIISAINGGASKSSYNVFSASQANYLIRQNILQRASLTGKNNTLTVFTVYKDNTKELIYETETLKKTTDNFAAY